MARGFEEGEDISMSFQANCIRFGRFKVQPIQKVELSLHHLRIIFRTNESSSQDDSVEFEMNPHDFVKTLYMSSETSTKFLFCVLAEHLDCIKNDVKGLLEASKQTEKGRISLIHCWILIETNAFSEAEQKQFEEIASHLIGYDRISSDEMEAVIANFIKKSKNLPRVKNGNAHAAGDGGKDKVAEKVTPTTTAVDAAAAGGASKPNTIIEYPLHMKGAFSISLQSYECLAVGEFLDDAIIEFYMEFLRREVLSPEQRERTHFFSVFFYSVLTARSSRGQFTTPGLNPAQRRHERVAKWTKDVNIFEKDFLFVPVNSRNHWFLAIVCFPSLSAPIYMDTNEPVPAKKRRSTGIQNDPKPIKRPCILVFDSLGGEKNTVINTLREYLACEYKAKMKDNRGFDDVNMPGQNVRSPTQPNLCDCGFFVLQNMEQFFKDPIKSFELPIRGLDNWYEAEVAIRKRKDVAELIQRLMPEHGLGLTIEDLPQIELPN